MITRKLLFRYILIYIPMIIGGFLYCFNIVNIVSSLLLFLGGYIAIKNTFDYRMVKRNKSKVNECDKTNSIINNNCNNNSVSIIKKRKRNIKVRKREKY